MRLDHRAQTGDIPTKDLVRAAVTALVKQLNTLRGFHSLPPLTEEDVLNAIKAELRNL